MAGSVLMSDPCIGVTDDAIRTALQAAVAMSVRSKTASSLTRRSGSSRRQADAPLGAGPRVGTVRKAGPQLVSRSIVAATAPDASSALSGRALNVLKLMAPELTGEIPPRGSWSPAIGFIRKITMKKLLTARNCGPRTAAEIVKWAASRGVIIQPAHHVGKSLSAMWRELEVKFAEGKLAKVELVEALERSVRRRSTKIPLGLQVVLLSLLNSSCE